MPPAAMTMNRPEVYATNINLKPVVMHTTGGAWLTVIITRGMIWE